MRGKPAIKMAPIGWVLCGLIGLLPLASASDEDRWARENDAAVAVFRSAGQAASPAQSQAQLQEALERLDALLQGTAPDAASLRRARLDRVVVLAALGRNQEALSAVAALEAEGADLPAYVLSSAGDAAAGLPDPSRALARYEQALAKDPDAEAAHAGRIFALADLDRLDSAENILRQRLAGPQPAAVARRDRLRLALVLAWRGKLAQALNRSQDLLDEQAGESEFLIQHGGLLLQADQPRAALAAFEEAQTLEPGARRAALGRAQALDRLGRWAEARDAFGALDQESAQWRPLVRAIDEHEAGRAPQFEWTLRSAEGPDRELAGQEWLREVRLATARSPYGWRGFLGRREAEARFQGRDLRDRRQFLGASLQRGSWRLRGEINQPDDRFSDASGWAVDVDWRPSDPWSFSLGYADTTFDAPLRGREVGTVGDRWTLAARWQLHPEHAARASLGSTDYSDGNRSHTFGLGTRHAFAVGRRSMFILEPSLSGSRQSRQDVPYFSPERDLSLELGGAVEQRLWLRPGRRLSQAVEFGVGQQRQAGFDAETSARLGYRLQWDAAPGTRLFLRLTRSRRAYDGVPEYQTRLEFGGWWSLRWNR